MTRHFRHIATTIILIMVSASFAMGASLTVNASGNGIYTVQGSDMDDIAGIQMTLNYDTGSLSSPTVTLGSLVTGAMMAANTNIPGSIRIAIIRINAFTGSGPVATITFATHTGNGSVSIASSSFANATNTGTSTNASTGASGIGTGTDTGGGGGNTSGGSNTGGNTGANTGGATGSSGPTYLGTVTMPSDSQPQNEAKPAPAPETAAKPAEAPASAEAPAPVEAPAPGETPAPRETPAPGKPAAAPKKAGAIGTASNTAVLERFRAYQGVKTPAIMIALFKQPISQSFRQEPFVALSDGTTTVTIVADLPAEAGISPSFALNGAKLVSLKKDDSSSTWIIEALPAKGALNASLMVLSEDHVTKYPLTIAPAIPNAASTEAEFAAFLKDADKTPALHDVNGDGKYDGVDDYIYTVNYLVRQQKAKPAAK